RPLKPCIHGGGVWEISGKSVIGRGEIFDFSSNINPLGPSPKSIEAIKNSLELIPTYPDPDSTALRDAIAGSFSGLSRENVIVGNGSTELIYLFADVFMSKGDVALIPVPTFGEYEKAVRKAGARSKFVKLSPSFKVEPAVFARERKGVKAIFVCNATNP
ncbi:MAG: aminotransferase class I/II-fold pyridoxal phosphate-dependent enzyme, partial [Candidatus Bathyarchaeia archaeon]